MGYLVLTRIPAVPHPDWHLLHHLHSDPFFFFYFTLFKIGDQSLVPVLLLVFFARPSSAPFCAIWLVDFGTKPTHTNRNGKCGAIAALLAAGKRLVVEFR